MSEIAKNLWYDRQVNRSTKPRVSMERNRTSTADNWLAAFPFKKLPLELQLLIGRFTVEHKQHDVVLNSGTNNSQSNPYGLCLSLRKSFSWADQEPLSFGLAHVCHALHAPLMRRFFLANTFDLRVRSDVMFEWVLANVGKEYMAMITSLALDDLLLEEASIEGHFKRRYRYFPGVKFLDITKKSHPYINRGARDAVALFTGLFLKFPRLEKITLFGGPLDRWEESYNDILDLRIELGATEKRAKDMVLTFPKGEPEEGEIRALGDAMRALIMYSW